MEGSARIARDAALPDDPRFANMVERVRNRPLTDRMVGGIWRR